eukprot:IDg19119t1
MLHIEKKDTTATRRLDAETDLIKRIHRRIGGVRKLTEHEDPTLARDIVLKALADVVGDGGSQRIASGNLTALERRVV